MSAFHFNNRIWDRDFLDWMMLLLAVVNLIVVVVFPIPYYYKYLNIFVVGLCFELWLLAGLINKSLDTSRRSINLNRKLLEERKELYNSLVNRLVSNVKKKSKEKKK